MSTVAIADVADDVVTIETCQRAAPSFADGARHERLRNPFLSWEAAPATLRMYRLRDVVLDRALMVLLKNGRVIAETNYLQSPAAIAETRVDPERLVVADIGHAVATCCDHWDANYYHWVAHTLPTVQSIMQRHPGGNVGLIVPRLTAWQHESLGLIGASGLPTVTTEIGAQYFLPLVEYYDFVAGRADFSVSPLSRSAYARMSSGIALPDPVHPLVYIDRSGSPNRRLPNEAALIERLRRRGFHAVRPETLLLDQQIALFKAAEMVVGQLGAGLANIAFCKPGTVVYELVPHHHLNPCFVAMAMQGGLRYWGDSFPTGVTNGDHTNAWIADIDIDHVMRRIDELAASTA